MTNYEKNIDNITIKFYEEKFEEGLQEIKILQNDKDLNPHEILFFKFLEVDFLIHQNTSKNILNILDELSKNSLIVSNFSYEIVFYIMKIHSLANLKKNNESLSLLDKNESLFKRKIVDNNSRYQIFNKEILSMNFFLKGINQKQLRNFQLANDYLHESLKLIEPINKVEAGFILYLIGHTNHLLENYSLSTDFFEKSLKYFQKFSIKDTYLNNTNRIFRIYNNIGLNYWKLGNLDKSLIYYEKAINLGDSINETLKSFVLGNLGMIYWEKGELEKSLFYSKQSQSILEKINNKPILSKVLSNIGNIYTLKGENELTFEYYNRALEITKELNDEYQYALVLNNIGEVYQSIGDFKKSFMNYKESLEIFIKLQTKIEISLTLYNLINLSLILKNKPNTTMYFEMLKEIKNNDKENAKVINQTYLLCIANIKKYNLRFVDIGEAQRIYKEIIQDQVVKHEYQVESILQSCELLLLELKFSGEEEILVELTELINKLNKIATEQNSFLLLCSSYMLLSKISILNFDTENIENSRDLLESSKVTAEERGYKYLANKIAFEIEAQQRTIDKINVTDKNKLTFEYLIELTEIESYVSKIITNKIISLPTDIEDEEPRLILLIAKSGIPFFSYSFGNPEKYDSSLISGFFTAMNSFFQETFSTDIPIERITQKEYTILFRRQDQVTYCYVFKGPSFKAVNKFEAFILDLINSEAFMAKVKNSLETGFDLHKEPWINAEVAKIFEK